MDIKYIKNPIKQAIVRVDFLNSIKDFDNEIPAEIGNVIKGIFPISEPKELVSKEFLISNQQVQEKEEKVKEWNFYDVKRQKRLCITNNSFFIDVSYYVSFTSFLSDFHQILKIISGKYTDIQYSRVGVRYINHIILSKGLPYNWSGYLNKNLLSIFNISSDKNSISRAFQNLEMNYGDFNLRFQFGMHNPDYPAQIKQKIFILDFDAFYGGLMSKSDIEDYLPIFHEKIQELFENSITDKYRKLLDE